MTVGSGGEARFAPPLGSAERPGKSQRECGQAGTCVLNRRATGPTVQCLRLGAV